MRAHRPQATSHIERYRQSGNDRPSAKSLKGSLEVLESSSEAPRILIAAEMCIDLGFADGLDQRAYHFGRAKELLEDTIDQVDFLQKSGHETSHQRGVPYSIQAQLRLLELPHWEAATDGTQISENYELYLESLREILSDDSTQVEKVRSTLVELVPVLLGKRALHRSVTGWDGRLALSREESRMLIADDRNPNWDSGLLIGDEAVFDAPNARLQLKSGKNSEAQRYQRGGVIPISAKAHGFGNPLPVIYGCLLEEGALDHSDQPTASTSRLDDITQQVITTVMSKIEV
ncbi:hypothetical protein KBD20_04040 [Candidatus Saccharibacteria bacterium]|nr:hypothetical protein [Candidatus Saccharibacteria bacterium]